MQHEAGPLTTTDVSLAVEAAPLLSYAMAHNRIPVIDRVTITNRSSAVQGAALRIEIVDAFGVVGAAQEIIVDVAAGSPTVLADVRLVIDPAAMLQVEEQRPAVLVVALWDDGVMLAEHRADITLLAARQWLAEPVFLSLELLAAFVMPNHPAVTVLVSEAAELLGRHTGSPSMPGYQSGAVRVDEVVEAIYVAMQHRLIRYATPPASWMDTGQKVRTPEEVLDGRVGTCLDTVVVMAAALEQAGIRPLIWIAESHAFLGYWRVESALDAVAQTEVADVVNRIDLGQIRLVETTAVVMADRPVAFADTHRRPYSEYLTGSMDRVVGVTDVWRARRNGILPLPARLRAPDGSVTVVAYHPPQPASWAAPDNGAVDITERSSDSPVADVGSPTSPTPGRVEQWKNALLDLSLRNRLINFSERSSVGIAVPDNRLASFEDALNDGSPISLLPADQVAQVQSERGVRFGSALPQDQLAEMLTQRRTVYVDIPSGTYETRLRALSYRARTIVEETGANNLYVALGSLVWRHDDRDLRSPLILVPVHLSPVSKNKLFRITLDDSGSSTPNYCLLEKLRQVHGLVVPGIATPAEDGSGIDLDSAMRSIREAVLQAGLAFRVEDTAHLAVLQFAKFRLWKDLDEHWETMLHNPLVRHLVESPNEAFVDPVAADGTTDLDELAAVCPVAADSSQLGAVASAVAGSTFVLEGPPGTGKSQTITNLLARAIGDGKRVLFVAEKRAALDVVKNRLEAVGLGPLSLDLHDKSSKPSEVRSQIRASLDRQVSRDAYGSDADAGDLRAARATLSRYAERVHAPNALGLSLYGAHASALALHDRVPALTVPVSLLSSPSAAPDDGAAAVRRASTHLADTADIAVPRRDHPWRFVDAPGLSTLPVEEIVPIATSFDGALGALPTEGPVADVVRMARSADELGMIAMALAARPIGLDLLDETRTARWNTATDALIAGVSAFIAAPHPEMEIVTSDVLQLPLTEIDAQARAAADAGFFRRKSRLNAVRSRLDAVIRPGVHIEPKSLPSVTGALVQTQTAIVSLAETAGSIPGLAVPAGWNPLTDDGSRHVGGTVDRLRRLGAAVDDEQSDEAGAHVAGALRQLLASPDTVAATTVGAVSRTAELANALMRACRSTPAAQQYWSDGMGVVARWISTRSTRQLAAGPQTLQRWTGFTGELDPLAAAGMDDARRLLLDGTVRAEDAALAFERGIAEASVPERRAATGLAGFDAAVHERTIGRFLRSSTAVRTSMATTIPEQVIARRSFDRASVHGRIGALQRELAKQRRGLGVRRLLHDYGDLITQVMPCVLVSPDSLARFFPVVAGLFDTVVFDEASQIRVADAVGAMGRATSVVVVGDSKQMPPTSFAEPSMGEIRDVGVGDVGVAGGGLRAATGRDAARLDGIDPVADDSGIAVEDEESILSECVQARVQRHWLTWHYRSQDESLIAFSNQQYYEHRLSSFPAPGTGQSAAAAGDGGRGVSLVRVDGVFHRSGGEPGERSTNPIEASAIVAEIERRFAASPDMVPSIGVVTFNIQQRTLIEAMLHASSNERIVDALEGTNGEGLFVKNLENVQGDERDVIFFSTAFSPNARGSLPLNFGPLNRDGGERRLNVAITRARRQVVVFSSFDPEQLRAEETSSTGIKHLRAYLDMAKLGTAVMPKDAQRSGTVDQHREDIAAALRRRGAFVRTDVGLSEFRIDLSIASVEQPDRPLVAVLLDGPAWARRRTVGDRDGLPVDVLSHLLHWPAVERIWLPAWLDDPGAVVEHLFGVLDSVLLLPPPQAPPDEPGPTPPTLSSLAPASSASSSSAPSAPSSSAPSSSAPVDVVGAVDLPVRDRRDVAESPFTAWVQRSMGRSDVIADLPQPDAARLVAAALAEIVSAEGPVHVDRLARLAASAFGVHRLTAHRRTSILAELPADLQTADDEPFVWPATLDRSTWRQYRPSVAEDDRPMEHISRLEVANAMVALCTASAGMPEPELKRAALAVFGVGRLTAGLDGDLSDIIDSAIASDRLTRQPDGLVEAT